MQQIQHCDRKYIYIYIYIYEKITQKRVAFYKKTIEKHRKTTKHIKQYKNSRPVINTIQKHLKTFTIYKNHRKHITTKQTHVTKHLTHKKT